MKIQDEGFESWKIHLMELVDEFRRSLDPRLLILPPGGQLDPRLQALLASVVLDLCAEAKMDPPDWAGRSFFLPEPWFPAAVEALKASAIVESPVYYRKNNIFVLENFLKRDASESFPAPQKAPSSRGARRLPRRRRQR